MAYSRQEVEDNVTIMNAALYNNLQDGIDESLEKIDSLGSALDSIITVQNDIIGGNKV